MKALSLSGSSRENVGKKDAKALRKKGMVPAVVYGSKEQKHLYVKHSDFEKFVFTPNVYFIDLDVDGDKRRVIIQDYQQHPVTDNMQHVDFLELEDKKPVRMEVPVKLTGNAIGVINGGRLAKTFRRLRVQGLPGDIPDNVEIDISKLRIGMAVRVSDLNENVTFLHPQNQVVVAVKAARGAVDDDLEEDEEGEEGEEGADGEEGSKEEAAE